LKLAFTFQGKYLGMSPFQCPSLFSILSFLEYEHGVWHPIGGCGAVSQVMARLARNMGAHINVDEAVVDLRFSGRKVTGVRTNKRTYEADATIINADFAHAMTRLVPDHIRRRWTNRKIAKKKFSCSTFMMYLGLDGQFDELPHHTIYLAKDYEKNLAEIGVQGTIPTDPSIYVQNASVTDPTLAPGGRSTLYVLVPVPNLTAKNDWQLETPKLRQRVFSQLARLGIENIERRIRVEHVITPDDWQRQGIFKGATFNLAHSLRQMLHLRPQNRFEDLDSVYLVGGGTHPGSGLPTIYSSARIASSTLLQDLGVARQPQRRRHLPALRPMVDGITPETASS
jgi:phytoene desaturase